MAKNASSGGPGLSPACPSALRQIHASAGSGKTYALTASYMGQLRRVTASDPAAMSRMAEGILAVTFTNAAASEMRERIIRKLKETALGLAPPDEGSGFLSPARAREWLEVFLANASALNIRTIDSLLHQIIRASALQLRISPDFETVFDEKDALAPLLDANLELAGRDGIQHDLLLQACGIMVESNALRGFGKGERIIDEIRELLGEAVQGRYEGLADPENYDSLRVELERRVHDAANAFLAGAEAAGCCVATRRKKTIEQYANGDYLKNLPAYIAGASTESLLKSGICSDHLLDLWRGFCDAVREQHAFRKMEADARKLVPLINFARQVASEFLETSQDFLLQSLVPQYARKILASGNGVSDALCRLGSRLQCALIDEFQDTSQDQWSAIRPLAIDLLGRGGSLTWVGDIKQSIYGWRGGDANLFDAPFRDRELLAIAPDPSRERLDVNRRSRSEIVEHNNAFFASLASRETAEEVISAVLPKASPGSIAEAAGAMLAAAYADAHQQVWDVKGRGGYVSFQSITESGAERIREESANRLLTILREKIAGRRPWSDVLVLVRGTAEASVAVRILSSASIPVITENGLRLAQNRLLNEVVSFLRFLSNPEDDISLWAALRGEILGSQPEAAPLLGFDWGLWAEDGDDQPLYRKVRDAFPEIWEKFFAPFYSQEGLLTVYDLIREYFSRMSLERFLPLDKTMLRRFMEMAYNLECSGITTIADFLDYWERKGGEEKAPMPENMNAVRIMTIHKAKGLQAPVVILPSTMFAIKAPRMPLVEKIGDCLLPVKSKVDLGNRHFEEMASQAREALNLLYVAMTRAEEELYVIHSAGHKGHGRNYLDAAVDRMLTLAGFPPDYESGSLPEKKIVQENPGSHKQAAALPGSTAFGEDWRPMAWLPRIKIFRNQLNSGELGANERGTLVHAALERISFDRQAWEASEMALDMASRALGMKVPPEARKSLLDALSWFVAIPHAKYWRQAGFAEYSLMSSDGELLRPDLVVPTPYGPVVIDYKTGQPQDAHLSQVGGYLECLEASGQFDGTPAGLLVYLDLRRFRTVSFQKSGSLVENCPVHFFE